jgi:hypothetical protein
LRPCQLLFLFGQELRVARGMPIGGDHHRLQAQVQSDLFVNLWQRWNVLFYQDGDKIAVGGIFGDVMVVGRLS